MGQTLWYRALSLDSMLAYHFEYDDDRGKFKDVPYHDWSSHCAKATELMARVWQAHAPTVKQIESKRKVEKFHRLRREIMLDNHDPYMTRKKKKKGV